MIYPWLGIAGREEHPLLITLQEPSRACTCLCSQPLINHLSKPFQKTGGNECIPPLWLHPKSHNSITQIMIPVLDIWNKQAQHDDGYNQWHAHRTSENKETLCVNIGSNTQSRSVSRGPWRHRALEPGAFLCVFSCLQTRLHACLGVFFGSLKSTASCGLCGPVWGPRSPLTTGRH